jgi:hypothetical protein
VSNGPVNSTEQFVLSVCQRSFLSLWCHNNPKAKDGKELCDILVICDPHVIVISVKAVLLKGVEDLAVGHGRWERRAVDASVKQIYGAERWLASASHVIRKDGSPGLNLPPTERRKVHRIAVAFGGRGEVAIKSGDFGKGFIHVMSEHSFQEVMAELDTIADLVEYLTAKEDCVASGCSIVIEGSESNLLGLYLFNGRSFPSGPDLMTVEDGIWRGIQQKPEYKRRQEADHDSYAWDKLIEQLADPTAKLIGEAGTQLNDVELALRAMARENRFARRCLGRGFLEFLRQATARKLRSRLLTGPSGVIYVFVFFEPDKDATFRIAEVGNRCFVARHRVGVGDVVVGVGIGRFAPGVGSTSDLVYLKLPNWSTADDETAVRMKADLGFFETSSTQHSHEDEYPAPDSRRLARPSQIQR